jgi:HSP20 family molecular chaperone IbpA
MSCYYFGTLFDMPPIKINYMNTEDFRSLFPWAISRMDGVTPNYFSEFVHTGEHKIIEEEKEWKIKIPIPGVLKEDITVSIRELDKLTIEVSEKSEWNSGIVKKFKLNPTCDIDNISVKLVNGILTIDLPKKESHYDKILDIK